MGIWIKGGDEQVANQKVVKKQQAAAGMAVMAVMAAVTFYLLFKDHSMENLWAAVKGANPFYLALGFLCMAGVAGSEAAVIRMLAGTFAHAEHVTVRRSMLYSMTGFYFGAITPSATGGQPMQLFYMIRDGVGFAQSSFALLTATAFYQLAVLGYGAVMLLIKAPLMEEQPPVMHLLVVFGILINGLFALGILLILFCRPLVERLASWTVHILGKLHLIHNLSAAEFRVESAIDEYSKGSVYLRKYPMVMVWTGLLTLLKLTCLYLVPYTACLALGIREVGIGDCIALQAILSLAVSAVPLPGSVGASEGSFLLLYQVYLNKERLLPMMVLSRGISFYGFLILSGGAVLWLHTHRKVHLKNEKLQ